MKIFHWMPVVLAVSLLVGCAVPPKLTAEDEEYLRGFNAREALRKSQETPTLPASLSCVRHGQAQGLMPYVQGFWVEQVPYGQMSIGMNGGDFNCGGRLAGGYLIPVIWRPGMKVKVKWDTWETREGTHHTYTTTIPRYADNAGDVWVHLFPNGQARVIVSNIDGYSEIHPLPPSIIEPPPEVE